MSDAYRLCQGFHIDTQMIGLIFIVTLSQSGGGGGRASQAPASPWVLDNRGEVLIKEHCASE